MPLFSFEGRTPIVDPSAFIAPTATLIGDVHVEAGASVWFNTVLRADFAPIIIREGANVQDGSVLHAPPGIPTDVGPGATIAHCCVIHGVHIGQEAVIANHATVLDGAVIGRRSLVARARAGGRWARRSPTRCSSPVSPAKVRGPIAGTGAEMWVNVNPGTYQESGPPLHRRPGAHPRRLMAPRLLTDLVLASHTKQCRAKTSHIRDVAGQHPLGLGRIRLWWVGV